MTTATSTAPGRLAGRAAAALGVGLVLLSSITVQVVTAWPVRVAVGVAVTAALLVLARTVRSRAVGDLLAALGALSVFGWFSAGVTAVPAVGSWLATAPVPLAFLAVTSTKLSSLVVLVVVARHRGWTASGLLVRRGRLNGSTGVPGLRWAVAGPLVVVAVLALFLTAPGVLADLPPAGAVAASLWVAAPVALAGAVLNAGCEELLYRHGFVLTAAPVIGSAAAVLVSSAVFGLGHITGSPGGWIGVGATFVYGLVCAAAMLQNRGLFWNLTIHVCGDLGAVTALVLASS